MNLQALREKFNSPYNLLIILVYVRLSNAKDKNTPHSNFDVIPNKLHDGNEKFPAATSRPKTERGHYAGHC